MVLILLLADSQQVPYLMTTMCGDIHYITRFSGAT